jgi:peptidoglycan/xylan/chitin deacetylase (PgdA/CDA1 family)
MIGVIADPGEYDVVREFFELFKTPWDFYRSGEQYDVVLTTVDGLFDGAAKLVVFYAGRETRIDQQEGIVIDHQPRGTRILLHQGNRIPIYGETVSFPEKRSGLLRDEDSSQSAACLHESSGRVLARIGYDIFDEIRTLLTVGQPNANADIPALELHIAVLRDLITACGIPLVEIPPVPDGYRFLACLTHDVDHALIRQHRWDHTSFGFLYRAVFGSLFNVLRGRMSLHSLAKNWAATAKFPFVHLGLAKDFWLEFGDRYLELENGLPSTFFVIPVKDHPGNDYDGPAPPFRAAHYCARDIEDTIRKLAAAGCEIGLHGIDAWLDSANGRAELEEIRSLTGASEIGVRMHWLYYDQQSPITLENAGATYDSTIGYNETVGYLAGTTQVYRPLQASQLLELPLHAMDTALFYPGYLGLSTQQAKAVLSRMVDNVDRLGGCLTINWHDRSILPERLWNRCYDELLRDAKSRGAWFPTAGQAVAWFRKRRSAVFEADRMGPVGVRAGLGSGHDGNLPGLRFRIHKARTLNEIGTRSAEYKDTPINMCGLIEA